MVVKYENTPIINEQIQKSASSLDEIGKSIRIHQVKVSLILLATYIHDNVVNSCSSSTSSRNSLALAHP